MDTFRLGGVDQLLYHADELSLALEVISSPDQVAPALDRLKDCDLVLLDTAGRSSADREQLQQLQDLLEAAQPDATHLVISSTSSIQYAQALVEIYSSIAPSHLLISKMDEPSDFGSWLTYLLKSDIPLSYVTTGQKVPDDLSPADPVNLATSLFGLVRPRVGLCENYRSAAGF